MTDGTGTTTYAYDQQGNLTSEDAPNGKSLSYTWDAAGNMASMTYPDGNTISFGYDSQNNMSSITDWLGNTTSFTYDGAGNLKTETLPNGTVTTNSYDSAERLDKIATTKAGTLQFSFDASGTNGLGPDGNIQYMTTSQSSNIGLTPGNGTGSNAGTDPYQYDSLQRVTSDQQTGPSGTTTSSTNTYTDNSEIKSATGPVIENGSYTYQGTTGHDSGQVQSIGTGLTFGYDNNGNRTCQGTAAPCGSNTTNTYTYDAQNQLTCSGASSPCSVSSTRDTFTYDGNGQLQQSLRTYPSGGGCGTSPQAEPVNVRLLRSRRLGFAEPLTSTCTSQADLTWSTALGDPSLAVDQQTNSGVDEGHTDYIMGPDGLPVEQLILAPGASGSTATPDWYYLDFQGNTRVLEDATGTVQGAENYPLFGQVIQPGSSGSVDTPLQYAGSYVDANTGFVYDQARWCDPSTGQFLSQDPLVDQTVQPYRYAGGDPVSVSATGEARGTSPKLISFGDCLPGVPPGFSPNIFHGRGTPTLSLHRQSRAPYWVGGAVQVCYMDPFGIEASGLELTYWYQTSGHGDIRHVGAKISTPPFCLTRLARVLGAGQQILFHITSYIHRSGVCRPGTREGKVSR